MEGRIHWRTVVAAFTMGVTTFLVAGCEDRAPQDVAFAMDIAGGELMGESLITVNQDDNVTLNWTSDTPLSVHLHGYDIQLALQPGVIEPMTFVANATGRFTITTHGAVGVHAHGSDEACHAEIPAGQPKPSIRISAVESRMEGNIFIEVDVENLVIEPGGGHWHLNVDGVDYGMYSRSYVTVAVQDTGTRVLEATLADANHCLYDASDSATVLISSGVPESNASPNGNDTPTEHGNLATATSGSQGAAMVGTPDANHSVTMGETPIIPDTDSMNSPSDSGEQTTNNTSTSLSSAGVPERVIATLEVRP